MRASASSGSRWSPRWPWSARCSGDNLGYLIGRRYGRGWLERHGRKVFVTPERLELAERYYLEHGGKTVFLGRFIPVVRSVGFIVAGVSRRWTWKRFFVYDVLGALIWGVGHSAVGYAARGGLRAARALRHPGRASVCWSSSFSSSGAQSSSPRAEK